MKNVTEPSYGYVDGGKGQLLDTKYARINEQYS